MRIRFLLGFLVLNACDPQRHGERLLRADTFDVYTDGTVVHLVGLAEGGVHYRRSTDFGAIWSEARKIDSVESRPGSDVQVAGLGESAIVVWSASGTGYMGSGPLVTVVSKDGGATWTPGANPADDGTTDGHGFIDVAAGGGAFHMVWLDGRGGTQGLRYARSPDGAAWSSNADVDPETCECCWNSIAVGAKETFVLYRDRAPRDMALAALSAEGAGFVRKATVGAFDWSVDACPHVGGGLGIGGKKLHAAVWTGREGEEGVHYLSSIDAGKTWSQPFLLAGSSARHADLASWNDSEVATVWDATADKIHRVMARYSSDGGETWSEAEPLSRAADRAHHPRVVATRNGFLAFWLETKEDGHSVVLRSIHRGGDDRPRSGS